MSEQGERKGGVGVDAVLPRDMARHAEVVGREKAEQSAPTLLILAALVYWFVYLRPRRRGA